MRQAFPGGVQFIDSGSAPFQTVSRAPSVAGGVFLAASVFASESFSFKNRITADAGLRFDHSEAISQDLPVVDAEGLETDARTPASGPSSHGTSFHRGSELTVKLDRTGRTMLRASYGRFNQGVLTGELDPVSPGVTPITTMAYDAATGGYTKLVSVVQPKNLALDPEMGTPHTDEFSLALDRDVKPWLRASAAYIRKRGGDFIGWTDTGGRVPREYPNPCGRQQPAGPRTDELDRRSALSSHESREPVSQVRRTGRRT